MKDLHEKTINSPSVTAVIVTYCSRRTIGAALDSIGSSKKLGLLDVIVVDNASNDGTTKFIREHYPWVMLIEAGANLGFGRGCNLGFEKVRTPYTLFLNPDAIFPQKALKTLINFMESKPAAAMCAPAIREANGDLQVAGVLPTPLALIMESFGLCGYPQRRQIKPGDDPFQTNWLCGAILLVRSDAFRAIGKFDPRFFLYFEETDLCRKMLESNYEIWAVGEAYAEHECGSSSKQVDSLMINQCIPEHYYKSRFYYLVKHHGWLAAVFAELGSILFLSIRTLVKLCFGKKDNSELLTRVKAPVLKLPRSVKKS